MKYLILGLLIGLGITTFTLVYADYLGSNLYASPLTNSSGVGSSTPGSLFAIHSTTNLVPALGIFVSNATGTASAISVGNGTSSILFVRSDGNIGIGSTTPSSVLSINTNDSSGRGFPFNITISTSTVFSVRNDHAIVMEDTNSVGTCKSAKITSGVWVISTTTCP